MGNSGGGSHLEELRSHDSRVTTTADVYSFSAGDNIWEIERPPRDARLHRQHHQQTVDLYK